MQRAIGGLVDEFHEERLIFRFIDTYCAKGAAIIVCQDEETSDWQGSKVPILNAWDGSGLKMMGLDALPIYKRVVAWLSSPVEDTEPYFQRLPRLNW